MFAALFVFCCVAMAGNIHADSSGEIVVSYTKEENEAYPLSVEVQGEGSVSDGGTVIWNGHRKYLIALGESMTFTISPDQKDGIKEVILNEENVTSQLNRHSIIVEGQAKGQTLKVRFRVRQTMEGPQKANPLTGDPTKAGLYVTLSVSAVGIVWWIIVKPKKKHSQIEKKGEKDE